MEAKRILVIGSGSGRLGDIYMVDISLYGFLPITVRPELTDVYFNEDTAVKPARITYGPERKGRGGKVRKW